MAAKKYNPISNLKHFAHPPNSNVNFPPKKSQQTQADPKMMGPKVHPASVAKHPGFSKGGKKVMK